MVTLDDIAKRFEEDLLNVPEEERIDYLRQLGFSITPAKVKQRANVKVGQKNVAAVAAKAKRSVRSSKIRTGVVGRAQAK